MAHPVVRVSLPILVPGILNNTKPYFSLHNLSSSRVKGFTLLELLIVIVIVSILFSYATLSIRTTSPEELIKEEAQRLHRLIQLALEEAVLKNTEYGIEFAQNGYRFLHYQGNQWQAIDDKLLRQRELPNEMEIELAVEQLDIVIGESPASNDEEIDDEKKKPKPQVFLLSSEEITPEFSARFTLEGVESSYIVVGTADGKNEIEQSDF